MKRILVLLTLVACGCATMAPTIDLTSKFDPDQIKPYLQPGANKIQGSAIIRQQGGGVVTCAGCEVFLIPVCDYSTERMNAIYHSTTRGYSSSSWGSVGSFNPDYPEYHALQLKTIGDAQGMFEFDSVASGEYYLVTSITWVIRYVTQGGNLMQRVIVSGGETKKVVLSP